MVRQRYFAWVINYRRLMLETMRSTKNIPAHRKATLITTAALVAAACIVYIGGGGAVMHGQQGWMGMVLKSPYFLGMLALTITCAIVLGIVGAALWCAGSGRKTSTSEGSAILEFALVMPIALMIVLVMIQSSLLLGGNICVNYAAFCAARSAIVHIPTTTDTESCNELLDMAGSQKMLRIKNAALWATFPVSRADAKCPPVHTSELEEGVRIFFQAYGRDNLGNLMKTWSSRVSYAHEHTTVWVSPPKNEETLRYHPNEDIQAHVRHTFYLSVPYAARVFSVLPGGAELSCDPGQYGTEMYATCTLTNEGKQDYVDREEFPYNR